MNLKIVVIGLSVLSVVMACSPKNESVQVVSTFWQAYSENDQQALASVLVKPEDAEFLAGGKSTLSHYEVLNEVADGVDVKFSRFCYPDVIVPTKLVNVSGQQKVDFMATLRAQMKALKNVQPLKKYCYDFDDKVLSGMLGGMPWSYKKMHVREINWGTKISQNISVYSEDCDVEMQGQCTAPKLIISNLKLEGEGGNFTNQENLTIHEPPGSNNVVSTGSYRISTDADGQKKVEISFSKDSDNHLSGYFFLDKTL